MPTVIWTLVSGHRPMASVCYGGPCLLLQTLEVLTRTLDALDSEVSRRSFSFWYLGHLSETPAVTNGRPV